jgi:ribonuclease E
VILGVVCCYIEYTAHDAFIAKNDTNSIRTTMDQQIETQGWRKRAAAGKARMAKNAQMAALRAERAALIAKMEGGSIHDKPVEAPAPAPAAPVAEKKAAEPAAKAIEAKPAPKAEVKAEAPKADAPKADAKPAAEKAK